MTKSQNVFFDSSNPRNDDNYPEDQSNFTAGGGIMGPASRVMGPTSGGTNNNPNWSIFIKAREIRNISNSSIVPEDESLNNGCEVVFLKDNKYARNKSK